MVKTIVVSKYELPHTLTGSWTTLYDYYLSKPSLVDALVCAEPRSYHPAIQYSIVKETFYMKVRKKWYKNRFLGYTEALGKLLQTEEKYVIQIVDNYGMLAPIVRLLEKRGIRRNCYIQFFYHGFDPFFSSAASQTFFSSIDELVLLTKLSYLVFKDTYNFIPCKISVLHNGIDTDRFFTVSKEVKQNMKQQQGLADKKVFIWCSQDRPKKGLDFILGVWKKIYLTYPNAVLLVIGAKRNFQVDGVQFLGRIPNQDLPKYYQMADVYLFPTLWKEGFGLSLVEALHCGCYCIASALGGVPEVLDFGNYGKLIVHPHFELEWVAAIADYLNHNIKDYEIPKSLYSLDSWCAHMDGLIYGAKDCIL